MHRPMLAVAILLILGCLMVTAEERLIFRFDKTDASSGWQTVNDGVMGGRSSGRIRMNADKHLEFYGTLSLANNGGFASIRVRNGQMQLSDDDILVARVRGDGRTYNFNLYAGGSLQGISYRQSFQTKKNEWVEVELPVKNCVATWRGRRVTNRPLKASDVTGLGILLGDKKPGAFKLEIEWIKVKSGQDAG